MSSKKIQNRHLLWIPIIFSGIGFVFLLIALSSSWLGESGQAALDYCETSRNGWIKQPANTWSNFGFILIGLLIAFRSYDSEKIKSSFYSHVFFPFMLSLVSILIGLGSFAFHASTTIYGLHADAGSMYLLSSFMLAYGIMRYRKGSAYLFLLVFLLAIIISFGFHIQNFEVIKAIDSGSMIFGFFLILALFVEILYSLMFLNWRNVRWMIYFVITFGVSVTIWTLSLTDGILCDPDSILQGHAIWHILDALCIYFIYQYYLSESFKSKSS